MNVSYVRVSSDQQSYGRQKELLKDIDINKIFEEKISGKNTDRPKFQEMLDFVRDGDKVYVSEFSRLARSTADLLNIIETLEKKNVKLVSLKENFDTSTPMGKMLITMIGAINQFERELILERQRIGIDLAVKEGRYKGGIAKKVDGFKDGYQRYKNREISKAKLSEELQISRPTLNKLIQKYERGEL